MAAAVKHSERSHALLSASGASRWLNCTPSARLEDAEPKKESSVYAAEGTLAHEFGEVELLHRLGRIPGSEYTRRTSDLREHELYYEGMEDEVDKYVEFCLEEIQEAQRTTSDAVISIEERVDLTQWIPEAFGTNDFLTIADGELSVVDLKFGKGVKVEAKQNAQLMLYGLGSLYAHSLEYDIQSVRLNIVQPRLDHISSWTIPATDLMEWGENFVRKQAAQAFEGKGEMKAGSWCQFCKVKAKCPALSETCLSTARIDFAEEAEQSPALLSDSDVLDIYSHARMIYNWIEAVENYVLEKALEGKDWPGYKLVEGRSIRRWADEEEAKKALSAAGYKADDYLTVKLAGIGQVEKLVGKTKINGLLGQWIHKPEGKPTLVEASDKRPPLKLSAADDFS